MINEVNANRFNRALVKFLNITGGAPAPQASPELAAQVDLTSPRPDMAWLLDESLFSIGQRLVPNAAEFTLFRLRNPVGSGILVWVELIRIGSTGAGVIGFTIGVGISSSDLVSVASLATGRDGRNGGRIHAAVFSYGSQAAVSLSQGFQILTPSAGNQEEESSGWIMPPGYALIVAGQTATVDGIIALAWRERPLQTSEIA